MKRIVGLGACVLDTLITCDKYPKEDTKQKAEHIFLAGGGPVGNALVIAQKLGVQTEVLGGFGGDSAGQYLLDDFRKYGVGVENAVTLENASSFTSYIVLADDNATRTCVFDRGSVPDEPKNLKLSVIDDATVLHLDGNYLECAITAAKYAKEKGVTVAIENQRFLENFSYIVDKYDVSFCWDCGHEYGFSKGIRFMELYGDRCVALHIHDNRCGIDTDDHMIPFDGNIDFNVVAANLASKNYRGTLMLELGKPSRFYNDLSEEEYIFRAVSAAKKLSGMVEALI
jgi:hypothetical protein